MGEKRDVLGVPGSAFTWGQSRAEPLHRNEQTKAAGGFCMQPCDIQGKAAPSEVFSLERAYLSISDREIICLIG